MHNKNNNNLLIIINGIMRIAFIGISMCIATTIAVAQYWTSFNLWDDENLYTNYNNLIEISAGRWDNSSLTVSVDRGDISGTNGLYQYYADVAGPMMLYITRGRDTVKAKKYLVLPFPKPKLCIARGNPRNLVPQDFAYGIWSPNPINHYQRLTITKIQVDYLDLGGKYTNSIIVEGDNVKNLYGKMTDIRTNKIWIELFCYKALDGSIKTVRNPEIFNCGIDNLNTLPTERFSQELPMNMEGRAIKVYFYPKIIATLNGNIFGTMDSPSINKFPPIMLKPEKGTNTFGFEVVGFSLRILTTNGKLLTYVSDNGSYTTEIMAALSALRAGDRFEVSDIVIDNGLKKIQANRLSFTIN
jgi:hypothetical protein